MFSRLKLRHILGATVIGVLLTYQNCSQSPSTQDSASSFLQGLPFAYVSKVDTIAYMSCSEIKDAVEPRAYFSYRVGAYNNTTGGIALSDPFRAATQYYSVADRANAFASSDLNSNTLLNLSIRLRSNMQSLWAVGNTRTGFEIDSFLPALDTVDVAGPLAGTSAGRMMNYFPGSGDKRLMEASLRFYEFENISKQTRGNLEGAGDPSYLTVGYSASADQLATPLRVPATLASGLAVTPAYAYGTGYAMTFAMPNGYSSAERRVISPNGGVQEIDLTTNRSVPAAWDCSSAYQFMVIRPEDKYNNLVLCNAGPDVATAAQQPALNAIRRVLRVEDWFVDMNNHCVMPKRTGDVCYGALQAGQSVTYGGSGSCVNAGATLCPHFVSVCIRH